MTIAFGKRLLPVAATLLFGLTALTATAHAEAEDNWSFNVYLDDKPIGFHEFELDRNEGRATLTTRAEFDVKILFINAFRYRHQNVETWQDGCLQGIDAETDNNGTALSVEGSAGGDGFLVSTGDAEQELPGCVQSFAYWNPEILKADRLLNSQTGEYEAVDIVFEGREQFLVQGTWIEADRYALAAKAGTIKLWYTAAEQRWLALDAPARGDRRIRYQPTDLPPLRASTRLAQAN